MAKGKKTNPEDIAAVINQKIADPDISLNGVESNYQVLCRSCNSSKNNNFIYNHNDKK